MDRENPALPDSETAGTPLIFRAPSGKLLLYLGCMYFLPALPAVFIGASGRVELLTGLGLTGCFWALFSLWTRHLFKMKVVFHPAAVEFFDPVRVKTHIVAYSLIYQVEVDRSRLFRYAKIRARGKSEFAIPDFFRDFDGICEEIQARKRA